MQTILATQSTASKNMPQLFQVKNGMAEQQYKEKLEVIVVVYIVRYLKQQSSNAKYVLICYENNTWHCQSWAFITVNVTVQ